MADKKWDKMSLTNWRPQRTSWTRNDRPSQTRRACCGVIDSKLAAKSATDKLAKLSDAERMALQQMINDAGSIESLANVNGLSAE